MELVKAACLLQRILAASVQYLMFGHIREYKSPQEAQY